MDHEPPHALSPPEAGLLLRAWRQRRRLSQLALATEAEISQRHLSFLESGRARPSREMVLRLGEQLQIPLRARNEILLAAGHAPHYPQRPLEAPALSAARETIQRILEGHMPHPALAADRRWRLLASNRGVARLLEGVAPHLLEGEVNVLRLSLHPEGLAPRILNLGQWRRHLLERLAHEAAHSADPALSALREELAAYPAPGASSEPRAPAARPADWREDRIALPLRLSSPAGPLSFLSTTTVFGTAVDVTLSEVTIEAFFPADAATQRAMDRLAAAG